MQARTHRQRACGRSRRRTWLGSQRVTPEASGTLDVELLQSRSRRRKPGAGGGVDLPPRGRRSGAGAPPGARAAGEWPLRHGGSDGRDARAAEPHGVAGDPGGARRRGCAGADDRAGVQRPLQPGRGLRLRRRRVRARAPGRDGIALLRHAVRVHGLPEGRKLSVHSGSDRFSLYPAIGRCVLDTGCAGSSHQQREVDPALTEAPRHRGKPRMNRMNRMPSTASPEPSAISEILAHGPRLGEPVEASSLDEPRQAASASSDSSDLSVALLG